MAVICLALLVLWSLYAVFTINEYEKDPQKIKTRKAAIVVMGSLVFLMLAAPAADEWGITGFMVVVLIFAIGGGITFYFDRDYSKATEEMFKSRCVRLGIQAKDWDELIHLEREQERRDSWENVYHVPWSRVQEIESFLQRMADTCLPLFDGMPRITTHLIPYRIKEGPGVYRDGKFIGAVAYGCGREIEIKKEYFDEAGYHDLLHTVKHEMTHCWIDWKDIEMSDPHGYEFQQKLREVSWPGKNKRKFRPDEVTEGRWIKHSNQGLSFVVNFHPGGSLTERSLSDESCSWGGSWELVDGVLRIRVGNYVLDVTASELGNEHSGVERVEGQFHTRFTVVHER